MYIECYDDLGKPRRIPAKRIVVYSEQGVPIAAAMTYISDRDGEYIFTATAANQEELTQLLQTLGINRTVMVRDLDQPAIDKVQFR